MRRSDIVQSLKASFDDGYQWYRHLDASIKAGIWLAALMFSAVALGAMFPRGSGDLANLGTWDAPIDSAEARRAIVVKYDGETGRLTLSEDPNQFSTLLRTARRQKFIRAHMKKFNRSVRGRSYRAEGLVEGSRDGLFLVNLKRDRDGLLSPVLVLRDLSSYNMYPVFVNRKKSLGSVKLRPDDGPRPFFSDGELGFFLDPLVGDQVKQDARHPRIPLERGGFYNAEKVTLVDGAERARASVVALADGSGVEVTGVGEQAIFLDNNPPVQGRGVSAREGEIIEIGGRFFEVHVEDSTTVAASKQRGGQTKRVYPMGDLLHIVGPLSLTGQHQPLGIEYMFQEYLMGVPEKGVPQGTLWLTIDRRLQAELSGAVADLAKYSRRGTASALIMNAKTGAVLAMSSEPNRYDPEDKTAILDILNQGNEPFYNHGCFKRHVIGSVTKPFFAFAGLQMMGSSFAEATVEIGGSSTDRLYGHRLYGRVDSRFEIKQNEVSFERYLIRSDNSFQHGMGLLLLAGVTDPATEVSEPWLRRRGNRIILRPTGGGEGRFLRAGTLGELENRLRMDGSQPFAKIVQDLFDIRTTSGNDIPHDRDIGIYHEEFIQLVGQIMRLRSNKVTDPRTVLVRRSTVCAPETPRMELEELRNTMDASNVLFGANRNRWTDVKLAEAFSRMMTGDRVQARLVHQYLDTLTGETVDLEAKARQNADPLELANPNAISTLKRVLERVPLRAGGGFPEGTASLLHDAVTGMKQNVPGFRMYAKTGTIDDGKLGDPDSRLLLCTFGVEENGEFTSEAFTLVVYLKTALDEDAVNKVVRDRLAVWYPLLRATSIGLTPANDTSGEP